MTSQVGMFMRFFGQIYLALGVNTVYFLANVFFEN